MVFGSVSCFLSRDFKHSLQLLQLPGIFKLKIFPCKEKQEQNRSSATFAWYLLAINVTPQALDSLFSGSFYSKYSFLSLFIVFTMFCRGTFWELTLFAEFYSSTKPLYFFLSLWYPLLLKSKLTGKLFLWPKWFLFSYRSTFSYCGHSDYITFFSFFFPSRVRHISFQP